MRNFWRVDVLSTNDLVYAWAIVSKLNVVVLGKPVIFSIKITEKLHGQCFWLFTVARGVVSNDHLKMLELFMFVTLGQ